MNVHHTLICFFLFLSLQEGVVSEGIVVYSGAEGVNITLKCSFSFSGSRMLFCKGECKKEDILIEANRFRAERGRYRISYEGTGDVSVTIKQLKKSDSGLYRCGLYSSKYSYQTVEIIVVDAFLDGTSEVKTLHARTGGNIVVECFFTRSVKRKFFCKDECNKEDFLVETEGVRVQKGRYNIEYVASDTGGFLFVGITQLTKSDSGRYRCGLDRRRFKDPYREFDVIVTDDPTVSKPNLTASSTSASTPTTQIFSSESDEQQTETTPKTDEWLYVGLTLAVLVVLLSLAVLVYCRRSFSEPKEPPVETDFTSVSQANGVYENIRVDRGSRPPPVDISTAYTYPIYTRPNAEDASSRLTYSELNFSKQTVGSLSSAVRGGCDDVVYSVPRTEASCGDEVPVYSNVS